METRSPRADGHEVTPCAVGELGKKGLTACMELIALGKAVDVPSAKKVLPRPLRIAVARKDGRIVDVGTIKPVRKGYAERTAEGSKFTSLLL